MYFDVHAQNMDLSDALKDYVSEKVLEPLRKLIDDPSARLEVRLKHLGQANEGKNHEVHAHFSGPNHLHADVTEVDADMYRAIDVAHHRLIETVRRQLEKRRAY